MELIILAQQNKNKKMEPIIVRIQSISVTKSSLLASVAPYCAPLPAFRVFFIVFFQVGNYVLCFSLPVDLVVQQVDGLDGCIAFL
jgi:hypothetical protein